MSTLLILQAYHLYCTVVIVLPLIAVLYLGGGKFFSAISICSLAV
jgi:hypothetical protein